MQTRNYLQSIKSGLTMFVMSLLVVIIASIPAQAAAPTMVELSYLEDGIAFVSLRFAGEALGLEVTWDNDTWTAYADSVEYGTSEDAVGRLRSGRIYVPLDDFAANHKKYFTVTGVNEVQFVPLDPVDVDGMMATLTRITETPRYWQSEEIIPTREYLMKTLTEYGYSVEDKTFEFSDYDYELLADMEDTTGVRITNMEAYYVAAPATYIGHNLVAVKEPQSRQKTSDLLIVGAHYDSIDGAPGANDNGSGLVTMLEIARLVKDLPSDMEVRFVCFDGEEYGLLGSYYYAQSLPQEDLDRVVGMINFDMLGAQEAEAVLVATPNGEANYLSGLFHPFELTNQASSDHFNFYGMAIPSVSICHQVAGPYHSPDDVIDFIDPAKLEVAATQGAAVISFLLSDAAPALLSTAPQEEPPIFNLKDEVVFGLGLDKASVENELGIRGVQIPAFPEASAGFDTAYTAKVNLWGVECELQFDYIYNDEMLIGVSGNIEDTKPLIAALDQKFVKVTDVESVDLSVRVDENSQVWLSDSGNSFILNKRAGKDILHVSGYEVYHDAEYAGGAITAKLSETEAKAWERLRVLIAQVGIENQIASVTFVEDGFGANDLYISSDFLDDSLSILIDPNELTDKRGSLFADDSLTYAFITGYAEYLFNCNSQIDYVMLKNKMGVEYGYQNKGFKSDSYFTKYLNQFSLEIDPEADYFDQYWQQQDIIAEMGECLFAYLTGVNQNNIEQAKVDFFGAFPEFQVLQ